MTGKRYSRQRELIYEAVRGTEEHPTAEMVYRWLKPTIPELSLGTVYRNLNLLADEGVVVRMPFSVERFDARLEPHGHFQCKICGRVMDVDVSYNGELDRWVSELLPGALVEGHVSLFRGICADCRE